jgi:DNA polymerase-1
MKLTMLQIDQKMAQASLKSEMLLQVHDELVFAVYPGELEQLRSLVVDTMQNVIQLSVPLEVHVGIGPNWELAGH